MKKPFLLISRYRPNDGCNCEQCHNPRWSIGHAMICVRCSTRELLPAILLLWENMDKPISPEAALNNVVSEMKLSPYNIARLGILLALGQNITSYNFYEGFKDGKRSIDRKTGAGQVV